MTKLTEIISDNPIFLAPMAGVNDAPFRSICKTHGAGLTYSEMISAAGIAYQGLNGPAQELLELADNEVPCAIQLFGSNKDFIVKAATEILELHGEKVALFDLNMGCPVPKVVNKGEGSALMRTPKEAAEIVKALASTVSVPVTVKFRSGWDEHSLNALEFADLMQEAGADALCVHPRTRTQLYRGKSDWDLLRQIKEHVTVPVIGSGDLMSPYDIKAMFEVTGVDAIMVARGAQGNPWIFSQTKALLAGKPFGNPTFEDRIATTIEHAVRLQRYVGNARASRRMRKHIMWYTHGLPGATFLRKNVTDTTDFDELLVLLKEYSAYLDTIASKKL